MPASASHSPLVPSDKVEAMISSSYGKPHDQTMGCHLFTVLLATQHKRTLPTLTPASNGSYSIYLPQRDGRLSWPRWLDYVPTGSWILDRLIGSSTPWLLHYQDTPKFSNIVFFASVFMFAIEMRCDFCPVRCETVHVVAMSRDLYVRCAWSAAILQTCCRNTLTQFMPTMVQQALPLHPTQPPRYTVSDLDLVLDCSLYHYIWIEVTTS